jgi:RNA polymerase sigma-70 factor (ECF subfamily)
MPVPLVQKCSNEVPAAIKVNADDCTAWVYRIVTNELRRCFRSKRARNRLHERFRDWGQDRLTRQAPPPGEALDFESVRSAMSCLDDKYSTVLSLRYFERLEAAEIAKIVKVRESTVRTRLRRGLIQLRAQLSVHQVVRASRPQA